LNVMRLGVRAMAPPGWRWWHFLGWSGDDRAVVVAFKQSRVGIGEQTLGGLG
jgi:hypothetical protein